MTDIQAAMGLRQLERLEAMHTRRREIVELYNAGFAGTDVFDLPVERDEVDHAWHLYPLRIREGALTITRDEMIEALRKRNIGTSVHFIPVHTFSYYREKYGYAPEDYPIAYRESERLISLPLHPGLLDGDVGDVVEAVEDIVRSR